MKLEDLTLDVEQQIDIKAPPEKVFPAVLEAKPGGRWYRDRGNGIGHLWGFVQVIKPPTLLELSGPMFMSYPAQNHIEIKVEKTAGGSRVTLRHRALGMIDPEHRRGVSTGWGHMLAELKKDAE
jgi:uncharacterized protein YndB with AHSA1/START domain